MLCPLANYHQLISNQQKKGALTLVSVVVAHMRFAPSLSPVAVMAISANYVQCTVGGRQLAVLKWVSAL